MRKIAVVLFNLGGPDEPDSVEPFLFNLFNDPAIITLPCPLRWLIAKLISRRRAPIAREIYGRIGGGSPLLQNTAAQAEALAEALRDLGDVQCFIAMRYWRPLTEDVVAALKRWQPDDVVLLPLYPQFSTTTTASSLQEWRRLVSQLGLTVVPRVVCCYPRETGFIRAVTEGVRVALGTARHAGKPRVLFSAHGLPKKIVAKGDPYQWQVEETCRAVVHELAVPDLDWVVCYQSRVGPLEWIGPATEREIERAGHDRVPVVVVPIAFVSEHSETLVELDLDYRDLAARVGVPAYVRVPTVSTAAPFMESLARLVRRALSEGGNIVSGEGIRICPSGCIKCPMTLEGAAV